MDRWLERIIWAGTLLACLGLAASWWLEAREALATVSGLQEEVDFAREAQGKAVQRASHCEVEVIQANAKLEMVDRWLQIAADIKRPAYGTVAGID